MASTVNITIQENLDAINLGVNDAESTVVITIVDGSNGYTPIKGVDYFDGINGLDGTDWSNVKVNGVSQVSGEITLTTDNIPDDTDKRYVTDAQLVVIGNTSGTNTGDNATNTTSNTYADGKVAQTITNGVTTSAPSQDVVYDALANKASGTGTANGTNTGDETTTTIGVLINNSTDINTIEDADKIPMYDAGGTGTAFKHALWSLVKSTLKTYFDTLYKPTFSENTAFNKNFGTTSGTVCQGNDSRLNANTTIAATVTQSSHTGTTGEVVLGTLTIPANTFTTLDEMIVTFLGNTLGTAGTKEFKVYMNTSADLTGSPIQIGRISTTATAGGVRFLRTYDVESTSLIKTSTSSTNNLTTDYVNNGSYSTYAPNLTVSQYVVLSGTLASAGDTIFMQSMRVKRTRL